MHLRSESGAGLPERAAVGLSHQAIGRIDRDLGRIDAGLAEQLQSTEILEAVAKVRRDDPSALYDLERSYDGLMHLQGDSGRWTEMLEVSDRALPLQLNLARANPTDARFRVDAAKTLFDISIALEQTGRRDQTWAPLEQAQALLAEVLGAEPDHPEARLVFGNIEYLRAYLLQRSRRLTEAVTAFEKAKKVLEPLANEFPTSFEFRLRLVDCLRGYGYLFNELGRRPEAIRALDRCWQLNDDVVNTNPGSVRAVTSLVQTTETLAELLVGSARQGELAGLLERARSAARRLARLAPSTGEALASYGEVEFRANFMIGRVLWKSGDLTGAEREYHAALAIQQKLADDMPAITQLQRNLADNLLGVGWQLAQAGKTDEAIGYYTREDAIRHKLAEASSATPADNDRLANCQTNMADVLRLSGRLNEALSACERAWRSVGLWSRRIPRFQTTGMASARRTCDSGSCDVTRQTSPEPPLPGSVRVRTTTRTNP